MLSLGLLHRLRGVGARRELGGRERFLGSSGIGGRRGSWDRRGLEWALVVRGVGSGIFQSWLGQGRVVDRLDGDLRGFVWVGGHRSQDEEEVVLELSLEEELWWWASKVDSQVPAHQMRLIFWALMSPANHEVLLL